MNPHDEVLVLRDELVEVVVDPGRGADVLSLVDRATGTEVLFSTPWRTHADGVRRETPRADFLDGYRGGWNVLCPNAGPARLVHGAPVGFHGEAATVPWEVLDAGAAQVWLRTTLFSVPVTLERRLSLAEGRVSITDTLVNDSDVDLVLDYVSHPAFGGALLDHGCTIATNARTYTADPGTPDGLTAPGSVTPWPADGTDPVGLRTVPPPGVPRMAFGWLADFDGDPWASITSAALGLTLRIDWDATYLPFAWFWQELGWTVGAPWYRRARAIAIEPSSTVTSGPGRAASLALPAHGTAPITVTLSLHRTEDAA